MPRFRKKPVVIEVLAERFDATLPRHQWPFGVSWEPEVMEQDGRYGNFYKLSTYGGFEIIEPGDWVIYGENRSVCTPDEFEATYEPSQSDTEGGEK